MINVYIEYGSATDHVATLQDEWVYMALLPSLEKLAQDNRGVLSESVFEDTTAEEFLMQQGVPSSQLQNLPWFDYGNILTWLEEYSELRQKSGVADDTDKARKYILAGHSAILAYEVPHYELVAEYIKNNNADIFEISSMDGIYELLEQLRGWDNFIVITSLEQQKINKHLQNHE